jgi:hypothetical protein
VECVTIKVIKKKKKRLEEWHNEINPLNDELNPICHLLALLGGATIVVVSRLRVNGRPKFNIFIFLSVLYVDGNHYRSMKFREDLHIHPENNR